MAIRRAGAPDLGWIQITTFVVTGLLWVAFAVGMRRVRHPGRGGTWGPPGRGDRGKRPRSPRWVAELLRVVSELVAAAGREDVSVMDRPMQGNETGS